MDLIYDFNQLQQSIDSAKKIFIVFSNKLDEDKLSAGLSLALALEKKGKEVFLFSSSPLTVRYSFLVGVDRIKNKIEGDGLVISLPKKLIEKVSYNEEEDSFDLIIRTKKDYPPLTPQDLKFSSSAGEADLILLIGTNQPEELGEIYNSSKEVFQKGNLKGFDLEKLKVGCWSEMVANFLASQNYPVDEDIASNLLVGLEKASNGFDVNTGPGIFEAAAFCLRMGGRRKGAFSNKESNEKEEEKTGKSQDLPVDWFTPKIYKSNTKI